MAARTRKGPASAGPGPNLPGTIHLGDDFTGVKDAEGKVLVDDTGFFRERERERPIWEALEQNAALRSLRGTLDIWMRIVATSDAEAARRIGITQGWIEQAIVATCAAMIEEAKKNG